jgi:hypothetical protein
MAGHLDSRRRGSLATRPNKKHTMSHRFALAATLALASGAAFAAPTIEYLYFYDTPWSEPANPISMGSADVCGNDDVCATSLSFHTQSAGMLTVTGSTALGGSLVVQDQASDYGGLGVAGSRVDWKWKTSTPTYRRTEANKGNAAYGSFVTTLLGDDEIDKGETLTLSFEKTVHIAGMHFFSGAHGPIPNGRTFTLTVDGVTHDDRSLRSYLNTNPASFLTGKTFTFTTDDSCKNRNWYGQCTSWGATDFYLGAVKITTAVPEPETYALYLAGLVAVGFTVSRRTRRR